MTEHAPRPESTAVELVDQMRVLPDASMRLQRITNELETMAGEIRWLREQLERANDRPVH